MLFAVLSQNTIVWFIKMRKGFSNLKVLKFSVVLILKIVEKI